MGKMVTREWHHTTVVHKRTRKIFLMRSSKGTSAVRMECDKINGRELRVNRAHLTAGWDVSSARSEKTN